MKNGRALFVYGTLRVGEGNFPWLEPAMVDTPDVGCTTHGHLWFYRSRLSYPVARFTDRSNPSTIKGDVLWCDPDHRAYQDVASMETNAGYEIRRIVIQMPDGNEIVGYGFHYLHEVDVTLSIRDGDWQKAVHEHEMPDDADDWYEEDWEPVV